MSAVRYDLSRNPANFNFLEFLVARSSLGATEVYLDMMRGITNKYDPSDTMLRIQNIVIPSCALAGCSVFWGVHGEDYDYHISAVLKAHRELGHIKKLKSVLPHGNDRYTITIRDYERYPKRNSNREAWERFGSVIGAVIVDDYYKKPIDLHRRMALYCGAEMNFMVCTGPASLCYFSDAPCMIYMKYANRHYHEKHGFPIGSQLPWLNKQQRFVWEDDDSYDNLMRNWELFQRDLVA